MAAPGATPTTPKSDSGVAELQRVLKAYVQVTGFTSADPGAVDGLIGLKTANAVIAIIPRVPDVPASVVMIVTLAPLWLASTDGQQKLFDLIKQYASVLAAAIIGMEVVRAGGASPTQPGTPTANTSGKNPKNVNALLALFAAVPSTAPMTSNGIATQPQLSIWFFDGRQYRIAVPRSNVLAGIVDYIEVAPSVSRPNFGTEVARSIFMKSIGRWWATPWGIAAIAGGVLAAGGLTYVGTRALMR